ncbi:MAG: phosphopantothenate/pantothenate synthetase [archaeon]|nr:phosphopantothenate/pantothenate synthetase [archaeon]
MTVPPNHPRYKTLVVREYLARMVDDGLVDQTGLISHGRGEAFDYLMGGKTLEPSLKAEKVAAAHLLKAKKPLICVNGNATVLCAEKLIQLAKIIPAPIEVNLFHRTEERIDKLIKYLESKGGENIIGNIPTARIPGLEHNRALCSETLHNCDCILVPIEDGDRAEALVKMGKTVISIDINPISRTSKAATIPISDEIDRALTNIIQFIKGLHGKRDEIDLLITSFSRDQNRREVLSEISEFLKSQ